MQNERYSISKLLETIENLSSNKNYNNCNTVSTNNSCNNDSEIPRSKNTNLAPPQWDILSTTSDTTTTTSDKAKPRNEGFMSGRAVGIIILILLMFWNMPLNNHTRCLARPPEKPFCYSISTKNISCSPQ